MAEIWHTKEEKKVILEHGGTPLTKQGTDGVIRGKPVEVRSVRKDDRYRIQKDVHEELVKKGGSYIFVKNGRTKKVPAKKVSKIIGRGKWYRDRVYPHKFAKVRDIFNKIRR